MIALQNFAVFCQTSAWISLEGLNGEEDGREFQKGEGICIPMDLRLLISG